MDHQHDANHSANSDDTPEPQASRPQSHGSPDETANVSTANDPLAESAGVLSLIAKVDEQLNRIRSAQHAQDEELNILTERLRELEQTEQFVKQQRETITREREQFDQQRETLTHERENIDQQRHEIERDRQTLQAEREQLDEQRQALESENERVMRQREEFEQAQIELGREREHWDREQHSRESKLNESREEIAAREQELAQRQKELDGELDRLRQLEQNIQQQRDAMDREREELTRRIEDAERRHAESEHRINELTGQLQQSHHDRDQLDEKLSESRQQLDAASAKLEELASVLGEQNLHLNRAASAMAVVKQQERRIAELEEQLAQAGKVRDAASESAAANEMLARQVQEHAAAVEQRDQQIESLTATIEQLRLELKTAVEQPAKTTAEANGPKIDEDELRAKAKRIAQVATHIRRRHARLKRMRELLRSRGTSTNTSAPDPAKDAATHEKHQKLMQQAQSLERLFAKLRHRQTALAEAEKRMVRRWARPHAITVLIGIMVLLAANVAVSFGLANYLAPAERSASITIEPRTSSGNALAPDVLHNWQQWHAAIVQDESFIRTLAQRLRERRLDGFTDATSVQVAFRNDLTVDLGPRGDVTYTLAGRDTAMITAVLDVLAQSIVVESERRMSMRGDGAWAVARNERKDGQSLRYAAINDWTLDDPRLMWMLPLLGGSLLATVLLVWLIYTRLIRAKRIFDDLTSEVGGEDDSHSLQPIA
jgi:DNA repair exonuclease SbcCD ATPase subunit